MSIHEQTFGSPTPEIALPTISDAAVLDNMRPLDATEPLNVLVLRSVDGSGGGAESVILRTAAHIDPARVRWTVCCIRREGDAAYDFDRRAKEAGVDYREVQQRSLVAGGVLAAIRQIARQCRTTIVDAQDYKAAFFAMRLAQCEPVVPMGTLHGWSGHHWRERLLYYPAERLILATFPRVVAVSSEMRDTMVHWRCRPERIRVVPNGIDPKVFRRQPGVSGRVRTELGFSAGEAVIGAVGRLEQEKRFDVLLEAVAQLAPRRPELRLVVVGEGSLRPRLQQRCEELGIAQQCRFLGHRADVRELYHGFDLFVQSSDHEGSPTVIVEAMAMEVPVVATNVGGTSELIKSGAHGLLVPRRQPAAMAQAMETTLAEPDATRSRVAAARDRVETVLSCRARTRALEDIYCELAHQYSPGGRLRKPPTSTGEPR